MDTKLNTTDISSTDVKDSKSIGHKNGSRNNAHKAILFKTERLVSAIHLVTSLMDGEDFLRWELRTVAVSSLKDFYAIGHWEVNDGQKFISEKIYNSIEHITSLLDVGRAGGLISQMNHRILREEYSKLKDTLERLEITSGTDSFVLPENFFGEDLKTLNKLSLNSSDSLVPVGTDITAESSANTIKDTKRMSDTNFAVLKPRSAPGSTGIKGQHLLKKTERGNTKFSRRALIVDSTLGGGEYTIKDIILKISKMSKDIDCSEKTIQRDLTFLVLNKTLVKKGERRWSRYSRLQAVKLASESQ
ncbi:MAG: hypothetical protein HY226_00895 [Candidatus Vogelbacteria bacterium]|nr:hypothetical protein [Candidatus Vogelbacteria bacterium]